MDVQNLLCVVCTDEYTSVNYPRALPCGHTICSSCLQQILSTGSKCPECRSLLNEKEIKSYPENYAIWELSQNYNACYGKGGIKALKTLYTINIERAISQAQSFQKKWQSEVADIDSFLENFDKCLEKCEENKILFTTSESRKETLLARISIVKPLIKMLKQSWKLVHQAVTICDMENAIDNANKCRSDFDKAKLCWEESPGFQEFSSHIKRALWSVLESNQNIFVTSTIDNKPKWARVTLKDSKILLYSLQDGVPPHRGCIIPFEVLRELVPRDSPTVFLEVGWEGTVKGLVFIRMFGSTPRSMQTTLLCSGEKGPSYRNTVFYEVEYLLGGGVRLIRGGDYENNDGTGGRAIVDGIISGSMYDHEVTEGLLVSWPASNQWRLGSFDIYLCDIPFLWDSSSHGIVTEGLEILRSAARIKPVSSTRVIDCGLVIPS